MNNLRMGAAVSAAVLLTACGMHRDEEGSGPVRTNVVFAGQVDPALAGDWVAGGGRSELMLGKDGSLGLTMETPTPQGKVKSQKKGLWLADKGRLLLKYVGDDGTEQVVSYAAKRDGTSMTLSTKVPKLETKYTLK